MLKIYNIVGERWIDLTLKIYGTAQSNASKYNRVIKPTIKTN